MKRDFTLDVYYELISSFLKNKYLFFSFEDYLLNKKHEEKLIIMRHDIDKHPQNALRMAILEKELGVKASYYFRSVKESFHPEIILKIADLGHEIGYHYEELSLTYGNAEKAIKIFKENLFEIRKYYDVKTICMHGSPTTKWDNKKIWENYNFKEFGIIGDSSFSINFEDFFYLTDTGRMWNNKKVSVRDCVKNNQKDYLIKNTIHLIELINKDILPVKIMANVHSQRWTNTYLLWTSEFVSQNIKNIIKKRLKEKFNEQTD